MCWCWECAQRIQPPSYKTDVHVLLPDLRLPCECCCLRSRRVMRLLNMWSSFSSVSLVFSFFQEVPTRRLLLLGLPFFSSSCPSSSTTTLFTLSRADNSKKPNESHILWNSGNDIPPVRPLLKNVKVQIKQDQMGIFTKKLKKYQIIKNEKDQTSKGCLFHIVCRTCPHRPPSFRHRPPPPRSPVRGSLSIPARNVSPRVRNRFLRARVSLFWMWGVWKSRAAS